jgi:hypothetical protein
MPGSAAGMIAGVIWQAALEMRKPPGRVNACGKQGLPIRFVIELKITTMGPTL